MKEYLKQLENVVSSGKLGHAYLFHGNSSEDLFELALGFAGILLGKKNKEDLKKSLELYLIEQTDEDEIKVESVRKLIGYLALSAQNGGFRVAIVKDADRMNKNAANALLKVLEEPSKNKILILTSSDYGKLLPTIISRVQKLNILTKQDNNVMNNSKIVSGLEKLLSSDISEKFDLVEKLSKSENIVPTLDLWILFFHDLMYLKAGCNDLIKNGSFAKYLDQASLKYSEEDVRSIIKEILNTKDILRNTNANARLALEDLVLNF